jgi:Spy/CpxP family protein refolding chaperone
MNTHEPKPRARRWMIAAVLAVASAAAGLGIANGAPSLHGHPVHVVALSPEAMDAHIDKMVEQCAAGASPDQKMRLTHIAKTAVADLRPVHQQFAAEHARAHALLMAPIIDRAALEQWRAAQMQRMDAMSRRVALAVEDGAEVLTPEQRAACGGQLRALMH